MRDEYYFSQDPRGAVIPSKGKTHITLYLDDEILASFRERAEASGLGYQTLINEALKAHLKNPSLATTNRKCSSSRSPGRVITG